MKNMKRYILFGLSLLMAFPLTVSAQDDGDDEIQEADVRTLAPKKKQYETRTVKGMVIDAATQQPVSGAIVRAAEIDGYSVLTEDDGTYELKVPVFATALVVTTPDYNPLRMGLLKDETQRTARLYPTTFTAEYGQQIV